MNPGVNVIKHNILKNAPLIAVILLLLMTVIIFLVDDSVEQKTATVTARPANTQVASRPAPQVPSPPASMSTDSDTANNVAEEAEKPSASAAPMLANLIQGLEKKVAADPSNTGSKMLLAQTYAEIGEIARGISLLDEIAQAEPKNIKISLVLASVLGKSDNPADLKRGMTLLDSIDDSTPDIAGSVFLQRGRLYRQMGENDSARAQWEQALKALPAASGYRKQVEIELARLK